jgi:hypothetical protein
LHLLLVLPDGSRSLIPASWTDLEMVPDKVPTITGPLAPIASLSQLLHTRTIVDALLRRREASKEGSSHCGGEECKGGAIEACSNRCDPTATRQSGTLWTTNKKPQR